MNKVEQLSKDLEDIINPLLKDQELALFDLSLKSVSKSVHIEIIVDKVFGGITLSECTALNKKISAVIEEDQVISDAYFVEVNSPGIDWPLNEKRDFLRVINREIRVFLSEVVEDKVEFDGVLTDVLGEEIVVKLNDRTVKIPFEKINKAIQII